MTLIALPGTTYVPHTGHCDIFTAADGPDRFAACGGVVEAPRKIASKNRQNVLAMTTNRASSRRKRANRYLAPLPCALLIPSRPFFAASPSGEVGARSTTCCQA